MLLPPVLGGLIDYLPTLSESVHRVVLAISAMTSSHNDDKDAVLPDQEGIAWDETGTHSRYTTTRERGCGASQWSLLTPSCVSSFHNAKERDNCHSRCRQKPIAFAMYCMICRGIVQKPSPFSWVCDVMGRFGACRYYRSRFFPDPHPLPPRWVRG